MSSSEDGSIRIWDTEKLAQKTVLKPTLRKPSRVPVTACSYSHDGGLIVAGLKDGSIQMWDVRGRHVGCIPYVLVQPCAQFPFAVYQDGSL